MLPASEKVQAASVPLPPIASTVMVIVVVTIEVMTPSM
jgi:hypothetical protein